MAEWARLVEEIVPDYCTDDDEPIPGREDDYGLVMDYRVELTKDYEHDLVKAAALQKKVVGLHRLRAAAALALPEGASLDNAQRNRLRSLGVSVEHLGHILRQEAEAGCEQHYQEAIAVFQRIGDKQAEAVAEFNLGHAYLTVPAIRDLDAAEAAYQRSLGLMAAEDALGRSICIKQIGMVHHKRFLAARKDKEPADTLLRHARAAEKHYLDGLKLCPKDALTDLAPMHNQLGNLYDDVGQLDNAREHFERAAQYFEKAGNRFHAGTVRFNMALMYAGASERESEPSQQRAYLVRARAYAEAALRDFQHYQGRAAKDEADTQALLAQINQDLAKLPQ
jgi:tetratricopeptide (TPR) repeat protein